MLPSWQCLNGDVIGSVVIYIYFRAESQQKHSGLNAENNLGESHKDMCRLLSGTDMDSNYVNGLRRSPLGLERKKGGQNSTHDCIYGDII